MAARCPVINSCSAPNRLLPGPSITAAVLSAVFQVSISPRTMGKRKRLPCFHNRRRTKSAGVTSSVGLLLALLSWHELFLAQGAVAVLVALGEAFASFDSVLLGLWGGHELFFAQFAVAVLVHFGECGRRIGFGLAFAVAFFGSAVSSGNSRCHGQNGEECDDAFHTIGRLCDVGFDLSVNGAQSPGSLRASGLNDTQPFPLHRFSKNLFSPLTQ